MMSLDGEPKIIDTSTASSPKPQKPISTSTSAYPQNLAASPSSDPAPLPTHASAATYANDATDATPGDHIPDAAVSHCYLDTAAAKPALAALAAAMDAGLRRHWGRDARDWRASKSIAGYWSRKGVADAGVGCIDRGRRGRRRGVVVAAVGGAAVVGMGIVVMRRGAIVVGRKRVGLGSRIASAGRRSRWSVVDAPRGRWVWRWEQTSRDGRSDMRQSKKACRVRWRECREVVL